MSENENWTVVLNRRLSTVQVIGPFKDHLTATRIGMKFQELHSVVTVDVIECKPAIIENEQLLWGAQLG